MVKIALVWFSFRCQF